MQIINPQAFESIEELDQWMKEWKLLTYKQRKISNDESIKQYGQNVYQMYDDMRAKLLSNNTDDIDNNPNDEDNIDTSYSNNIVSESSIISILNSDDEVKWDNSIIRARNAEALGEIIMIDTSTPTISLNHYDNNTIDYLEKKWRQLQNMSSDLRVRSDHTAQSIFGINNINLYNLIKNFIINDMEKEASNMDLTVDDIEQRNTININYDDILFGEIAMCLAEDDYRNAQSITEAGKLGNTLCIMENHTKPNQILPFFTPSEMEVLNLFSEEAIYSEKADQSYINDPKSWYKNYIYFGSIGDASVWEHALEELYRDYNTILESGDDDKIASRKQAILELGWNPEINFSHNVACITYHRHEKERVLKEVNVSPYYSNYETAEYYDINSLNKKMIFTISTNEGLFVSDDMKQGILCERNQFNPCSHQRINELDFRGKRDIVVHCSFFDKDKDPFGIYTYTGSMVADSIRKPFLDICREAVSNFGYKDAGINVIKAITKSDKCYCLYDDCSTKKPLRHNIIYQMVNEIANDPSIRLEETMLRKSLSNGTIERIKACLYESTNTHGKKVYDLLTPSYGVINERVKVGTNEKGDIIIRNVQDVNTEFFKCHRNLLSYEKAQNYEGMKEELCKLKYLDNFAVKHMRNKNGKNYKEYADAHARITNDFNKYLKMVTDHEPDFNFTKYYEQSPWYDGGVRISQSFLEWLGELIAKILRRG